MRLKIILLFVMAAGQAWSQAQPDELVGIVKAELDREMAGFKSVQPAPYYLAYQISDLCGASISSSFGSVTGVDQNRGRIFRATVRVGDYDYDNTHQEEDGRFYGEHFFGMFAGFGRLPLDNQAHPIRHELWEKTQSAYQAAKQSFQSLKSRKEAKLSPGGDFSKEAAQTFIDSSLPEFSSLYQEAEWLARVKQLTVAFQKNPAILEGTAHLSVSQEREYFISSEGTVIAQNRFSSYLIIQGSIRTADGDIAPLHLSYFAFKPHQLPSQEKMLKDVDEMIGKLILLQNAPRAEPYTGPAILYSRAAGVFFHEIFGHRVEGHRLNSIRDAQTFKGMLDTQVLPDNLSVISDPTLTAFNGADLNGSYQYDNEGIKSRKVTVVEKGILKTFLMSRSPVNKLLNSNGHGRTSTGGVPVSRQSNLIIVDEKPVAMKDLRKMLITECKKQKKSYGYLFMDVTGGFTMTSRSMPNAFNIFPTEVYRVYVDGRPDELVHGVNLIGTPLSVFAEIVATDNKSEIFTGFCGAESGSVPVTAIAPSILVKRIETQKKEQSEIEHSILPPPTDTRKP